MKIARIHVMFKVGAPLTFVSLDGNESISELKFANEFQKIANPISGQVRSSVRTFDGEKLMTNHIFALLQSTSLFGIAKSTPRSDGRQVRRIRGENKNFQAFSDHDEAPPHEQQ